MSRSINITKVIKIEYGYPVGFKTALTLKEAQNDVWPFPKNVCIHLHLHKCSHVFKGPGKVVKTAEHRPHVIPESKHLLHQFMLLQCYQHYGLQNYYYLNSSSRTSGPCTDTNHIFMFSLYIAEFDLLCQIDYHFLVARIYCANDHSLNSPVDHKTL